MADPARDEPDEIATNRALHLAELHRFGDMFSCQDLTLEHSCWTSPESIHSDGAGSFVETDDRFEHTESFEWNRPSSRVIGALLDHGLALESFHEHRHALHGRWPFLEKSDHGTSWMPEGMPDIPLMYSLRARKAA